MFQHQLLCAFVTHLNIRHLRQEIAVFSEHTSVIGKKVMKEEKKQGGGGVEGEGEGEIKAEGFSTNKCIV